MSQSREIASQRPKCASGIKGLSSMLSNKTLSKWELRKGGNPLDISFYCLKMISGLGDTLSGRLCLLNDICELSTKVKIKLNERPQ